ncbi:hypothetical protein Ac2012v2_002087 [Leucoagaricus gongylophorus]
MLSAAVFALASALTVSAADIQVNVGANNQLIFDPPQVTAQPGDSIHFQLCVPFSFTDSIILSSASLYSQSKNHSVTQSTFAAPCVRSPTGIDSGFQPVNATDTTLPVWTFQVTDTTPLWFFCAQTIPAVHCTAGMVFAVNPTADKTFEQFQNAATGGTASASNSTSTDSAAGAAAPATSSSPGVVPVTSASPGVAGSAASAPSQSGFATIAGTATAATAPAASSSTTANGAVGLSSVGSALSLVSLFAAVGGFML